MREARLPQKRRAGQGCSLQEILALELVIRGPAGGEPCRVHLETLFFEACGDPEVKHLKDYLREKLGVPKNWQRLLAGTNELDDSELLQALFQPGAAVLELTLLRTLSDEEQRERRLIVEWLQRAPRGTSRGRSDDRAGVVIGDWGAEFDIARTHAASSSVRNGAVAVFSANHLRQLPPQVWQADSFNMLAMIGCPRLERIPPEIGQFSKLVELEFEQCPSLESLPPEVGGLVNLVRLSLHDCEGLLALPAQIGSLRGLRDLSLIGLSNLSALPAEIGSLESLQELVIAGLPGLQELPPELGQLCNLRHLGLEQLRALRNLPSQVGCLRNLWSVLIVGCGVVSLPRGLLLLFPLRNVVICGNDDNMLQVIHPAGDIFFYRSGLRRRTQRILRRRFDKGFMTDGGFDALRTVLSGNMWPPWLAINSNNEYFDEAAVALGAEAAAERLERCFPGSPRDAPLGRPQRSTRAWPLLAPPQALLSDP